MNFSDINKGDRLVEDVCGAAMPFTVRTQPVNDSGKWTFEGVDATGETISFLQTEGLEHYGPKIMELLGEQ